MVGAAWAVGGVLRLEAALLALDLWSQSTRGAQGCSLDGLHVVWVGQWLCIGWYGSCCARSEVQVAGLGGPGWPQLCFNVTKKAR